MSSSIPDPDPRIASREAVSQTDRDWISVLLDPTVLLLFAVVVGASVAALLGVTAAPGP